MKDPSSLLRSADPLRDTSPDEALPHEEAQAIRRAMIAAIPDVVETRSIWRRPLAVAAVAALAITISGIVGHRLTSGPVASPQAPSQGQPASGGGGGERRQLQFSTPGGTRIIWIFDDSLRLQEPMP
jgi:hypothetical protein